MRAKCASIPRFLLPTKFPTRFVAGRAAVDCIADCTLTTQFLATRKSPSVANRSNRRNGTTASGVRLLRDNRTALPPEGLRPPRASILPYEAFSEEGSPHENQSSLLRRV